VKGSYAFENRERREASEWGTGWIILVDAVDEAMLCHLTGRGFQTVRSCAVAGEISVDQAHARLERLKKAGVVAWTPGLRGTLRLTQVGKDWVDKHV